MIGRAVLSIITWLSLALWLAAIAGAGIAAAGVFAILPGLEPEIADYAALPTSAQGRLASGLITEPIFTATDIAQIACSTVLLVCVALHWILGAGAVRPWARITWSALTVLAAGCLWTRILTVMPELNQLLQSYRTAAQAGELDIANAAYVKFNALHPTASGLMEWNGVLLILAIGALAVMMTTRPSPSTN